MKEILKNEKDYVPKPSPAVLLRYDKDDWDIVLEEFYREKPVLRHRVSVVLLPKGLNLF